MNRKLIEKTDALLAKEKGTIFKDPGGRINICLVYPNHYHVGMSNLGFQGIYGLLNRRNDVVCERAFLPEDGDFEEYLRSGTPVFSFESQRPLNAFDIVAFSISFENDYPNILKILNISKIPSRTHERNEYHPFLIAGGVCCFFNPEPIAEIFDIIFVGEAEDSLDEFMDTYKEVRVKGEVKRKALNIEGIYVPEFYDISYNSDGTISDRVALNNAPDFIKRRHLKDLSDFSITTAITTPEAEFSDMYLIEAMRGCPWSCRFCLVGHIYSPPRKKPLDVIRAEIERAKEKVRVETKVKENSTARIGLIGPSLSDYIHMKEVLCIDQVVFSITSLRASSKSAEIVELLKGHKSVSIAPEAGTERLRKIINKRINEGDILDTAGLLFDAGVENLRLYFMIGLPTETGDDISGIVELVQEVRKLSGRGNIILSVSTFVPKPFTPFQWHPMEQISTVKKKMKFIKKALSDVRGVKVFHDIPRYAHMQGLFSMGDRRVLNVLEAMARTKDLTDDWNRACSDAGLDEGHYIFRSRGFEEKLPWDFIDTGISKVHLWDEYKKSQTDN